MAEAAGEQTHAKDQTMTKADLVGEVDARDRPFSQGIRGGR